MIFQALAAAIYVLYEYVLYNLLKSLVPVHMNKNNILICRDKREDILLTAKVDCQVISDITHIFNSNIDEQTMTLGDGDKS